MARGRLVAGILALATLGVAPELFSQTVRVRTVEAGTNRAIEGAIVVLIDSASRRLAQGLTDHGGRLLLRAPRAGRFRLRADRIGHPGVLSDPLLVIDTTSIVLAMPAIRTSLPELTVRGSTQCDDRAVGERTAGLWEEIRKALSASDITSSTQSVDLAVRRFRRYRTLSGSLRSDSTEREYTTRVSPFASVEAAALRGGGFIRERDGQFQFFGPDARLLLSEVFVEDHCFQLVPADKKAPNMIGLGFRPIRGRRLPDIRGVLWVDHASAELRSLDFEFVNVPSPVRVAGLGGRVEFQRLVNGAWIIRDWYIRMPDRVSVPGRVLTHGGRPVARDTVVGFVDDGGIARPLGDVTVRLDEAAPQTRRTTEVLIELRGRVVSSDATPIAGALVSIAELDSVLVTGPSGGFQLSKLPVGRLRLRIRAIGHAPFGIELALTSDRRLVDTTFTLTRAAQPLDSIVVAGKPEVFRAGKMEEFERRRQMGFGKFLTRAELHDPLRGGLDMQLRRYANINLVPLPWKGECAGGYAAATWNRGGVPTPVRCSDDLYLVACFMTVYIDGSLYYSPDMGVAPPDLTKFDPLTLEAAEIYRSPAEMPPEYNATNSLCGVIVLWTRVG